MNRNTEHMSKKKLATCIVRYSVSHDEPTPTADDPAVKAKAAKLSRQNTADALRELYKDAEATFNNRPDVKIDRAEGEVEIARYLIGSSEASLDGWFETAASHLRRWADDVDSYARRYKKDRDIREVAWAVDSLMSLTTNLHIGTAMSHSNELTQARERIKFAQMALNTLVNEICAEREIDPDTLLKDADGNFLTKDEQQRQKKAAEKAAAKATDAE